MPIGPKGKKGNSYRAAPAATKCGKIDRPISPSVRKNTPKESRDEELDKAFLKQAELVFEDWNSDEDVAAFRDI